MVTRLDRFLANAKKGSRSQVRKAILSGKATVNGQIVKQIDYGVNAPNDQVTLEGERVFPYHTVYIMFHKPAQSICGRKSEGEKPPVYEWIEHPYRKDLSIAGRLDSDATGLLLLSNDGGWIHRIISPHSLIHKTYHVVVEGFDASWETEFFKGIQLSDGFRCRPVVEFSCKENPDQNTSMIQIGIIEGKYHQIKRMFQMVGSRVRSIHRIQIGPISLDPSLKPGSWRELTQTEKLRFPDLFR